ncbi:hypothetical protein Poly41_20540 [Novipirellula artificiosorum]|uniref:Uncharacterized protein n=1 Tax=Novipirellula artificiosorum TaxID=2528016 RepID=A0A5C6DRF1_9BACT|nr:hypothetical protein Poly41_20540 [Novipirellula artificiosorum]
MQKRRKMMLPIQILLQPERVRPDASSVRVGSSGSGIRFVGEVASLIRPRSRPNIASADGRIGTLFVFPARLPSGRCSLAMEFGGKFPLCSGFFGEDLCEKHVFRYPIDLGGTRRRSTSNPYTIEPFPDAVLSKATFCGAAAMEEVIYVTPITKKRAGLPSN